MSTAFANDGPKNPFKSALLSGTDLQSMAKGQWFFRHESIDQGHVDPTRPFGREHGNYRGAKKADG